MPTYYSYSEDASTVTVYPLGETPGTDVNVNPQEAPSVRGIVLDVLWQEATDEHAANGWSDRLVLLLGHAAFERFEEGTP